ncbi:MAG TPA: protein kinase [Thermoanaerobaculia bacterium]|nr:protein kinase [Thermoanaerobaculia bacterium]
MTSIESGTSLGHYRIVDSLGQGGMGEVYRANDPRLGRDVAVKVLSRELIADADAAARFLREARAVASLSHANILSIFDFGTENGVTYAVMELLEGETLRDRVRRGALPWREAAELAAGVADGLAAAHAKGIIHRDLKPENLFITLDGRVKILDFGLAHTAADGGRSGSIATDSTSGMIVGTIGYMAPEQLRAQKVEPASDLFALGCVLYEVLTGDRPFARESTIETSMAILREPAPTLSKRSFPADLSAIVSTCLEKEISARYASASDLALALRDALSGSGRTRKEPARRAKPLTAVAVLPFVNQSTDASLEYLGDGIAEAVINSLSSLPKLRVVPRATAFRYKSKEMAPREIAAELDVRSVVTGRVVLRGDTLVVSCELVDAGTDRQVWGQTYNRKLADIFEVQEQIALQISENLRIALTGEQKKTLKKRFTHDPQAYQSYMKGRFFWNKRTEGGFKKAIDHFEAAIEQDPVYALPYAGLADSFALMGAAAFEMLPPREAMPRAKAAAMRALDIDASLVEARTTLAFVRRLYDWDWAEAERDFRQACALNGAYPTARHWLSLLLCEAARFDDAAEEMAHAHELDPLSLAISTDLGWVKYFARDYDAAIQRYRATLELDPDFPWARFLLGLALSQTGQFASAIGELEAAYLASGRSTKMLAAIGHTAGLSGDLERARTVLAELEEIARQRYVSSYCLGLVHIGLADHDRAFASLDRACEERAGYLVYLNVDPAVDPIRKDPRFGELLVKTKRPVVPA